MNEHVMMTMTTMMKMMMMMMMMMMMKMKMKMKMMKMKMMMMMGKALGLKEARMRGGEATQSRPERMGRARQAQTRATQGNS